MGSVSASVAVAVKVTGTPCQVALVPATMAGAAARVMTGAVFAAAAVTRV